MTASRRYCLITPCRDEQKYARRVLDSVVNQTLRPALWLIVDDGSTDETPKIIAEYAERHQFIRVRRREDRGERSVGPGVVDAFYAGYDLIDPEEFDYVCKFDLDLDVPNRYFETLVERMEADERLGTCSGKPYVRDEDRLVPEPCGDEMSVGMTKFYRVDCFRQIGGFVREVMWDGIDCHRCRMMGWKVRAWEDVAALRFEHLRPMGSSQKGIITGRMRHGFGQYFMGTSLFYITVSAIFRMATPPVFIGGMAIWWGYVRNWLTRQRRYDDAEFRSFLRRYQWTAIRKGKAAAVEMIEAQMADRWRSNSSGPNSPQESGAE